MSEQIIFPGLVSRRRPPENLAPTDIGLFEHEFERPIPPTCLATRHSVAILPSGVISDGGRLVAEAFASPSHITMRRRLRAALEFAQYGLWPTASKQKRAYWFADNWSSAYFHWLTDALPRLFVCWRLDPTLPVLLPGDLQDIDFIRESLKPFRLRQVEFTAPGVATKIAELVIPAHTAPTGNYNDAIIVELRSLFRSFYGYGVAAEPARRIYISRSLAGRRKVFNEAAIAPVLERFGFETVHMETMSFKEQVCLLAETQYLVSNHGAGLSNMMFMPAGASVLEIRKLGDAHNNCYFSLAACLGLRYFYQESPATDASESAHTANVIVDEEKLASILEAMIAK